MESFLLNKPYGLKISLRIVLIIFAGLFLISSVCLGDTNLRVESSGEITINLVANSGKQMSLDGWHASPGISMAFQAPSLVKLSGRQTGDWGYVSMDLIDPYLKEGKTYSLGGWIKVEALSRKSFTPFFQLAVFSATGQWLKNYATPRYDINKINTWQKLETSCAIKPGEKIGFLSIGKGTPKEISCVLYAKDLFLVPEFEKAQTVVADSPALEKTTTSPDKAGDKTEDGVSMARGPKFGVNADNWNNQIANPGFEKGLLDMGVEFVVWHLSPEEAVDNNRLMVIVNFCRKNNFQYLFNTELVNYVPDVPYFKNTDGTYRWDLKKALLDKLKADPLFIGAVYDEPMLMQSMNGVEINGKKVLPYFAETRNLPLGRAHDKVVEKIQNLAAYYAGYNKKMIFEMVFPDYAHPAARGGAVLAPKLLKENYNDLMFSMYSGAARQYNTPELWACVDLWFLDQFPDNGKQSPLRHTPEDLYEGLSFAYKNGFDYFYIEHVKGLMNKTDFSLTDYGKKVVEFQYKKNKLTIIRWDRFKPEVVVKRFADGYWGQAYSEFIADHPYGSWVSKGRLNDSASPWLSLLHQLSNGKIPQEANNWNAVLHPYFGKKQYDARANLPAMLVFDHTYSPSSSFEEIQFHDLTQ